ncbi:lysozyme inhibitor LprI family protein [Acinetobacter sp. ULE_I001]
MKTLEPDYKQQLIKAQRLWVQFKEADCIMS